jgi:hypothetical protein
MTQTPPDDKLKATASRGAGGAAIPASLQAEYDELFRKREQLRTDVERARAELVSLKAREKAV